MNPYCDSSFLTSLYVVSDVFNPLARKEASKFIVAIPYTLLNELELINALQRGLGSHSLTQADYEGSSVTSKRTRPMACCNARSLTRSSFTAKPSSFPENIRPR